MNIYLLNLNHIKEISNMFKVLEPISIYWLFCLFVLFCFLYEYVLYNRNNKNKVKITFSSDYSYKYSLLSNVSF